VIGEEVVVVVEERQEIMVASLQNECLAIGDSQPAPLTKIRGLDRSKPLYEETFSLR